jgi:hypothetical protein
MVLRIGLSGVRLNRVKESVSTGWGGAMINGERRILRENSPFACDYWRALPVFRVAGGGGDIGLGLAAVRLWK